MESGYTPGLGIGLILVFGTIALPIIVSLIFLTWRFISINLFNKRANFKAPLIALALNGTSTACVVTTLFLIDSNNIYMLQIGLLFAVITVIFWVHDSLSWRKTKKGTRYFTAYVIASIGLIGIVILYGTISGFRLYKNWSEQQAKTLVKLQNVGTQLYLPTDMTHADINIFSYSDNTNPPYYIEIGDSIRSSQYNNTSIPSMVNCDSVISEYPNQEEHKLRCVFIGNINGMKVWNIITDSNHIEDACAIIKTTTIIITKLGYDSLTLDEVNDYIKSLHSVTNEELSKYPIGGNLINS